VRPQQVATIWIGVFGVIALLLAPIGLYGVVAQGVLQRTREFAVRAALGATPTELLGKILGEGMRLAIAGTAIGTVSVVASVRLIRSLFPGVGRFDVAAIGVAVIALGVAALLATYVPARRATTLNPVDALRSDS
jgi:ABC-type antimicrobial peptide transport system permease subunit